MCGIAGLVQFTGLPDSLHRVGKKMAATLAHRGPDDLGDYHDRWASLGHARLSIIDLANGQQPMSNETGTIQVVFNGEIYNYRELAHQLRQRRHHLRTQSDTEVLVHLYEEFGEDFVNHLNGMFAIAIWDAQQRKIVLVRDRMGIKPLYWSRHRDRIIFGSELKAIVASGVQTCQIDPRAIRDYLTFGHVPSPLTIYENINKLEPGCMVIAQPGSCRVRQYWDIIYPDSDDCNDQREWTEEFGELLQDAVTQRMIADVPLGAFLSGGIDSSTITAAMTRAGGDSILTHTVGFDESDYDERQWARNVADLLHSDHREIMVRPDAAGIAEQLAWHFDEPFADSCSVPMYYLSQATRQRVTVALAGDGADEMLAGYRRYRFDLGENRWRQRAPGRLGQSLAGLLGRCYPKADWLPRPLRAKRTLENIACDAITAHLRSVAVEAGTLPERLLSPDTMSACSGHDPFQRGRTLFQRCPSPDLLNRLLYVDMKTLMVDDILTKVDRASMAVGLEVRVPLLDHRIVSLAARLPRSMKLAGSTDKAILRRINRQWLGNTVADRTKKGFDVPTNEWFRGPLQTMAQEMLLSADSRINQWIEPAAVKNIYDQHKRRIRHHGHLLWMLLNLELWARNHDRMQKQYRPNQQEKAHTTGMAPCVLTA